MTFDTFRSGTAVRTVLSLCCLCAFAVLQPFHPAQAQDPPPCSNGRCEGATLCTFRAGESCAFTDPRTCVTYRCRAT